MSVYSIYFSPTGGTKNVADILTKEFSNCTAIDLCSPSKDFPAHFSENDLCYIAVPSFGGRVPDLAAKRLKTLSGNHAFAVLITVYGNRAYEDTLLELSDIVTECGFSPIAAVTAIAEHSIMHQFAAGRPDIDDIRTLTDFSARIVKKIRSQADTAQASRPQTVKTPVSLQLPGSRPYKKYGTLPFIPLVSTTCIGCKKCAALCPVGAIRANRPNETDADRCIGCMRCISICPEKARYLDPGRLSATAKKMAPLFKERKECELFL